MTDELSSREPTRRFSNRVSYYLKYRPRYPEAMMEFLRDELGLRPGQVVVDVGSGTGFLSELFLANQNPVYAVEPNAEMRSAAETLIDGHPLFHSMDATAENTGLLAGLADWITAGQAFHWFDAEAARREFVRIGKPGCQVALVWNHRLVDHSPFARHYEQLLLDYGTDYKAVAHQGAAVPAALERFFAPAGYRLATFPNRQELDFEGLQGRLLSSSYVPLAAAPGHEPMMQELRRIFEEYQHEGRVAFEYQTMLHYGRLEPQR